jgi:hypothetical protein
LRIASLDIYNFRGIRRGSLEDIQETSLVTFAGRNGVGKSLALLAIFLTWQGNLEHTGASAFVGPWDDHALVTLTLTFLDEEWQQLRAFATAADYIVPPEDPYPVVLSSRFDNVDRLTLDEIVTGNDDARRTLRNSTFRTRHPFAQIDFIPSERQISRTDHAAPDPTSLGSQEAEQWRELVLTSLLGSYGVNLYGIMPYLSTLDYAAFLEDRAGRRNTYSDDYNDISAGFEAATGKVIERPSVSEDGRIAIFVDAGDENTHSISQLSSGEQEALGLMYLVRRLSSRGGILIIDEPEQHLHPSLQRILISLLTRDRSHSQLWLSTHSAPLIASAALDSVVSVYSSRIRPNNQFERASVEDDRVTLLTDLGVPPSAWQQGDYLVVLEGQTDERYLTRLLPLELGRALVLVAGNAQGVERVSASLQGRAGLIPWVAVRDRDLADISQVARWTAADPHLYVWSRRAVENALLEETWISATLGRVGHPIGPAEVGAELLARAESQKDEIRRLLVERRLLGDYLPATTNKHDLSAWLDAQSQVFALRRDSHGLIDNEIEAEVNAVWPTQWKEWVRAKKLLAEFLPMTPFRTLEHLVDAMIATALEDEEHLPTDIQTLRDRLRAL